MWAVSSRWVSPSVTLAQGHAWDVLSVAHLKFQHCFHRFCTLKPAQRCGYLWTLEAPSGIVVSGSNRHPQTCKKNGIVMKNNCKYSIVSPIVVDGVHKNFR